MQRVLVAMSGGVDSSVAVHVLLEQGFECVGATMLLHGSSAGSEQDVADARAAARRLGIEHRVYDLTAEFDRLVVAPFVRSYEQGRTPSPCVGCNRDLKFGALWECARELGCDRVATGHYARVERVGARHVLQRAADPGKDQSYMLCLLSQEQLGRAVFPLGGMRKAQVRELAERLGLGNAHKGDSQDICFVPGGDYFAFLEAYRGKAFEPGDIVTRDGRVVGRHRGAACCTIGQRKGLGVALREPVYVCGKDMATNTVVLGPVESLLATSCLVDEWNWIAEPAGEPLRAAVKTHYRHREQPATLVPLDAGRVRVEFDEPQRAMTPGQFAVAYVGDRVVGGGAIDAVGAQAS